jgi:hypothetical protein
VYSEVLIAKAVTGTITAERRRSVAAFAVLAERESHGTETQTE